MSARTRGHRELAAHRPQSTPLGMVRAMTSWLQLAIWLVLVLAGFAAIGREIGR